MSRRVPHRAGQLRRRSFETLGSTEHYAPDTPFRLEHVRLDVLIDLFKKNLKGKVTHRVRVISPGQRKIVLDAVGMTIERVRIGKEDVPYESIGNELHIHFPETLKKPKAGTVIDFSVRYEVRHPQSGFEFIGPDEHYPKREYFAYSKGHPEGSRFWFPVFDSPRQKATLEMMVTVPKDYRVVSHGKRMSKIEQNNWVRYTYQGRSPVPVYSMGIAIGRLERWTEVGPGELPLEFLVPRQLNDEGKKAFKRTAEIMEILSRRVGIPYPFEKYAQLVIPGCETRVGGSFSVYPESVVPDARARQDGNAEEELARTLARQWFGSFITPRFWSDAWLCEGISEFLGRVWLEDRGGEDAHPDEAKYVSLLQFRKYSQEDKLYRRPLSSSVYQDPSELFDSHISIKGALFFNLLRASLGEGLFWKAIQYFMLRHKNEHVTTLDLVEAIEDATGKNVRRLVDEWVFCGGYPEFEIHYRYVESKQQIELWIEQVQTDGEPYLLEHGVKTPIFHLPVMVEVTTSKERRFHRFEIGALQERIYVSSRERPKMIRFDPNGTIPKLLRFRRSKELLLYQLLNDEDCLGRIEAAWDLLEMVDAKVLGGLRKSLLADPFWGVRAEVADVLARIHSSDARSILVEGLGHASESQARARICRALGEFRDAKVERALFPFAKQDRSLVVEAEALKAWTRSRCSSFRSNRDEIQETERFLLKKLDQPSHCDLLSSAALESLSRLPGIGRGERPLALKALIFMSQRGRSLWARLSAINALGSVLRGSGQLDLKVILELMDELKYDGDPRVRRALIECLADSKRVECLSRLESMLEVERDPLNRRSIQIGMETLGKLGTENEEIRSLRDQFEFLRTEQEHMRLKLEGSSQSEENSRIMDVSAAEASVVGEVESRSGEPTHSRFKTQEGVEASRVFDPNEAAPEPPPEFDMAEVRSVTLEELSERVGGGEEEAEQEEAEVPASEQSGQYVGVDLDAAQDDAELRLSSANVVSDVSKASLSIERSRSFKPPERPKDDPIHIETTPKLESEKIGLKAELEEEDDEVSISAGEIEKSPERSQVSQMITPPPIERSQISKMIPPPPPAQSSKVSGTQSSLSRSEILDHVPDKIPEESSSFHAPKSPPLPISSVPKPPPPSDSVVIADDNDDDDEEDDQAS